ncbi:hypothetical protein BAE44_0002858 [Dichanthelium oligosanthes]|uniref:Uncharacterized protein n=1 Tax=Dichanthelium oligosanthes TaxID=888268 RepID=A0A1E5WFF5_9POAL|nr:hypothetical protein BAE44_0002858 [Dichanthelium oligosanthes]
MSAMAAAPPSPRFDSVLSFGDALPAPATGEPDHAVAPFDSDDDGAGFEFAFAPPLAAPGGSAGAEVLDLAPADDLFAHGRIVPAYPVFDRHLLDHHDEEATRPASASTAPPSPDTYCAWEPRSAPGSPAREFPKSASTGEARRFWRLRGLVSGGSGRSHSDGKEKFLFLQPAATPSKMSGNKATVDGNSTPATKPSAPLQKQNKKKSGKSAGSVTEMDMATAHKLFYGKPGAGALAGDRKQQQSYLPYRPGIVGFFTAAHALGRSHHPY